MENHKNTDASIKNLETQVGQIAKQLTEQQGGTFTTRTQHQNGVTVGDGSKNRCEQKEM